MFPTTNPTSENDVHPSFPWLGKIVTARNTTGVATAWAWAFNVVATSGSASTIDVARLASVESEVISIRKMVYSPAGAGNTSNWVYEDIAGVRVEAFAIVGSEDLESLLSAPDAQTKWHAVWHGLEVQWKAEYSNLFRAGMIIVVNSISGTGSKLFRVKAGATVAQLLKNPTDPTVSAANSGYEPWSYE